MIGSKNQTQIFAFSFRRCVVIYNKLVRFHTLFIIHFLTKKIKILILMQSNSTDFRQKLNEFERGTL